MKLAALCAEHGWHYEGPTRVMRPEIDEALASGLQEACEFWGPFAAQIRRVRVTLFYNEAAGAVTPNADGTSNVLFNAFRVERAGARYWRQLALHEAGHVLWAALARRGVDVERWFSAFPWRGFAAMPFASSRTKPEGFAEAFRVVAAGDRARVTAFGAALRELLEAHP